jgi:cytochrome P450
MQYQTLEGFREHVENLIDAISGSRGVVDLQPIFYRFTLDTTTAMIFGQSVGSLTADQGDDSFFERFNEASLITATRVRFGDLYWLYTSPGFSAAWKAVKSYADKYVKTALQGEPKDSKETESDRYTFITDLYSEYKDSTRVRDQLVNVLLAGLDSTASLLSYTL